MYITIHICVQYTQSHLNSPTPFDLPFLPPPFTPSSPQTAPAEVPDGSRSSISGGGGRQEGAGEKGALRARGNAESLDDVCVRELRCEAGFFLKSIFGGILDISTEFSNV